MSNSDNVEINQTTMNSLDSIQNNISSNSIEDNSYFIRQGNIFFGSLLLILLAFGYLIFEPFWETILFSTLITVAFNPIHQKIKQKVTNETYSALISTGFITMFVLIPSFIFIGVIISQLIDLIPVISKFVSENNDILVLLKKYPFLENLFFKVRDTVVDLGIKVDFIELAKNHLGNVANFALDKAKGFLTNTGLLFADIFFVLMTVFFFFKDGNSYIQGLYDVIPLKKEEKDFLFEKSYNAIRAIFTGTIATAGVQGVLAFIAYLGLGIPFSFFWGFATFILSFLPLGGAAIIWLPISIYCFIFKSLFYGIGMLLYGFFIISMSDNVVRPLIIGSQTNINTLVLFFGILGGLQLFGFIGMFLAPVIIVLVMTVLDLYKQKISIY